MELRGFEDSPEKERSQRATRQKQQEKEKQEKQEREREKAKKQAACEEAEAAKKEPQLLQQQGQSLSSVEEVETSLLQNLKRLSYKSDYVEL